MKIVRAGRLTYERSACLFFIYGKRATRGKAVSLMRKDQPACFFIFRGTEKAVPLTCISCYNYNAGVESPKIFCLQEKLVAGVESPKDFLLAGKIYYGCQKDKRCF